VARIGISRRLNLVEKTAEFFFGGVQGRYHAELDFRTRKVVAELVDALLTAAAATGKKQGTRDKGQEECKQKFFHADTSLLAFH